MGRDLPEPEHEMTARVKRPRGRRPTRSADIYGHDIEQAFLARIEPDPNSGCWLWSGGIKGGTHGSQERPSFCLNKHVIMSASRYAYRRYRGDVPRGMFVLHRCDTPLCVNPAHLFLGDHAANMADMAAKGRSRNRPKLTPEQVVEVAARRRNGEGGAALAREFGISRSQVHNIVSGVCWPRLTGAAA